MKDPIVSIIIPVFNSASYLEGCIVSALSQTLADIEIICVDNGSTDDSRTIIEHFARGDSRVKFIEERRPGVSCARNAGLLAARGEFIAFLDSDDWVNPELAEKAVSSACRENADLVIYSLDECYHSPKVSFPWPPCPLEECYSHAFSVRSLAIPAPFLVTPNVWRILFRADFVRALGISFDEGLRSSEDLVFVYQALFSADRIVLLRDVLYHYRKDNPLSLTRGDRGAAGIRALRTLYSWFSEDVRSQVWFHRQFVNLVADTFQYQFWSASTADEYCSLYRAYQEEWSSFLNDSDSMLDEAYRPFFEGSCDEDPLEYLFRLFSSGRRDAERDKVERAYLANQLDQERANTAAAREEVTRIQSSRSWRFARSLSRLASALRRPLA